MEDRLTDLRNTLADLSAKHLAAIPIKDSGYGRLDMYAVGGRVVIVRVYQLRKNDPASWDLFIPVSDSSRIDETLAALRAWAQPAAPQEGALKAHEEAAASWTPGSVEYSKARAEAEERTRIGNTPADESLPPDPEGQNDDRAEWAEAAIVTFEEQTGTDRGDAVCDLLADLMHWGDRNGQDFTAELERAQMHYAAETDANG